MVCGAYMEQKRTIYNSKPDNGAALDENLGDQPSGYNERLGTMTEQMSWLSLQKFLQYFSLDQIGWCRHHDYS